MSNKLAFLPLNVKMRLRISNFVHLTSTWKQWKPNPLNVEPENVEECAESVCSKDLSRIPGWLVSFGLFGQKNSPRHWGINKGQWKSMKNKPTLQYNII